MSDSAVSFGHVIFPQVCSNQYCSYPQFGGYPYITFLGSADASLVSNLAYSVAES